MRRVVLAAAGWLGAAAAAALVGLLALTLLRGGVGDSGTRAVSQQAAAQALARAQRESAHEPDRLLRPTAPASSAPSRSSGSTPPSKQTASPTRRTSPTSTTTGSSGPSRTASGMVTRALDSAGGTLVARCEGNRVRLLSWTPRQGFEADDATQGGRRTAYLKFESDDVDVRMTVDCRGGTPVAHVVTERDD